MENRAISYLKKMSEVIYHANTDLDHKASKLVVSASFGKGETVNFKFLEDYNNTGYAVLMLNMLLPSFGKAVSFYLQIETFLEWYYDKKLPTPICHDFAGHRFFDWKPNSANPILVYSWGEEKLSITEINRLILGQEQK